MRIGRWTGAPPALVGVLGAALGIGLALPAAAQLRPLARPADLSIPAEPLVPAGAPAATPPAAAGAPAEPALGPETGLPLPRFVSLKTGEGNARRGPSLEHRIDWVFLREDMPLRVTAEHGHWRRVEDREGLGGWIHYSLLSGTRTVIVDEPMLPLRVRAEDRAPESALLEAGVVARVEACTVEWCRISAGGHRGWVRKGPLWGVEADEVLD